MDAILSQEEYYQKAADYTSELLAIIDRNYKYRFVNKTFLDAYKLTKEEIIGKSVSKIEGDEAFKSIKPKLDMAFSGENVSYERWFNFKGIGYKFVYITYMPVYDDKKVAIGVAVSYRDLSEQKKIEESLIETKKIIEKITITDWLTDLYNRRYFDEMLPKLLRISKRNDQLLAFAMTDLDHFKSYNDTYGYQAGDRVLKQIAEIFSDSLRRPGDYIFRLGSDRFAVLYNISKSNDGLQIAEDIRKNVEKLNIEHKNSPIADRLTISVGVTIITPKENYTSNDLYKITDKHLSCAKEKGRNRICY